MVIQLANIPVSLCGTDPAGVRKAVILQFNLSQLCEGTCHFVFFCFLLFLFCYGVMFNAVTLSFWVVYSVLWFYF